MNLLLFKNRRSCGQILRPMLGASLLLVLAGGCVKSDNNEAPSRRTEVSADRADGTDPAGTPNERSDAREPGPSGAPRASRGEVKRNEYTVQVGIFNQLEDAEQLSLDLRAQRVNNFLQPVGNQWRVCVGKYYTEGRASRMAKQLQDMGFKDAKAITPGN